MVINEHKNDLIHDNNRDVDDDESTEETEMRINEDSVNNNDGNLVSEKWIWYINLFGWKCVWHFDNDEEIITENYIVWVNINKAIW